MSNKVHLGHTARKRFGQNFLTDQGVISSIVGAIAPDNDHVMVEIGPGLGGITERRDAEWLMTWIKNSDELIKSGVADAVAVYEAYNKSAMPPFTDLSDGDLQGLIDYMANPTAVMEDAGGGATTSSSDDASYAFADNDC